MSKTMKTLSLGLAVSLLFACQAKPLQLTDLNIAHPSSYASFADIQAVPRQYLLKRTGEAMIGSPSNDGKRLISGSDYLAQQYGVQVLKVIEPIGFELISVHPDRRPEEVIPALRKDKHVLYVEPNYIRRLQVRPSQNQSASGSPLTQMAATASSKTPGVSGIIAILDTGIDSSEPTLQDKILPGYNLFSSLEPNDDSGHGTWMAGLIASGGGTSSGLEADAQLLPVKVLDRDGYGSDAGLIEGICWAVTHGAKVITLGMAGKQGSQALEEAVQYANQQGVTLVAAAGNDGQSNSYPAAIAGVLSVGALDGNTIASFSPQASWLSVVAPGSNLTSTTPQGEVSLSSMGLSAGRGKISSTTGSAAYVAALALMVKKQHPTWTPGQIRQRIQESADDLGRPGRDPQYGFGRVNFRKALAPATTTQGRAR